LSGSYVSISEETKDEYGLRCFPNPFQTETNIDFGLPVNAFVNLSVYTLEGQFVTCLINENLKGGSYKMKWRRSDMTAKSCKTGAFIAYLKVNGQIQSAIKTIAY